MFRGVRHLLLAVVLASVWAFPVTAQAGDDDLSGMVVGRTGEVLHVSVPQPLEDGTILAVKPLTREKPIAQALVLSCTQERPYIALAKVIRQDMEEAVPIGVRAYADAGAVERLMAPKPMDSGRSDDSSRFSVQAGAFYPSEPLIRDTVAEFWESYRLNYSLLKVGNFDTLVSAEYSKGSGDFETAGGVVNREMEVIPVTVMGRIKPLRMGSAHVFVGAGAGMYRIRSEERIGDALTSSTSDEFGLELATGIESTKGWNIELRYRDVEDTQIKGYSLSFGARF